MLCGEGGLTKFHAEWANTFWELLTIKSRSMLGLVKMNTTRTTSVMVVHTEQSVKIAATSARQTCSIKKLSEVRPVGRVEIDDAEFIFLMF